MIVDAHNHIFPEVCGSVGAGPTRGLGYGRIAVGEKEIQLLPPYGEKTAFTPDMLVANMDWACVEVAVILHEPFYGECSQYVLEALSRYPDRLIGAAYFDPWAQDSRNIFETITASSHFQAVKMECPEAVFGDSRRGRSKRQVVKVADVPKGDKTQGGRDP